MKATLLLVALVVCSFAQIQITRLTLNQVVHAAVGAESWTFYSFDIGANKAFHLHLEHGSKYDLDVYVRKGFEVPSLSSFDYSESGFNPNITIEGRVESNAQHYTAGVYGFRGDMVPFSIVVSEANGCPGSCSNHGTCIRNRCVCNNGYSGEACDQSVTAITLNQRNGPYTINKGEWRYWSVYLSSSQTVEIYVEKVGAANKGDVDFYVRRNLPPTLFEYDYADLTKFDHGTTHFSLNISNPLVGTWYIGAFGFEASQFAFTVKAQTECPNQCSRHGTCIGSSCRCNSGYFGAGCNDYRYPIALNTNYPGYVSANAWNYFKVQPRTMSTLVITVDHPKDGDCDLYVKENENPTLTSYTQRNVSLDNHIVVTVPTPGQQIIHIGVYGYSACAYTLKTSLQSPGGCDCGRNGRCVGGRCVCNTGWAGDKCQYSTPTLYNGRTRVGTVTNGAWQYFAFNFQSTHQFVVVMHEDNPSSAGRTFLYAQIGTYPTLDHYNVANTDTRSAYHRISFRFLEPYSGTAFLGVYRSPTPDGQASSFRLSAYQVPF